MSDHNELGRKGEGIACNYLAQNGYKLLQQNWRYKNAEIDIICKKDDVLIFVEVKTRATAYFGRPEEFVTKKKEKLIFTAANAYMDQVNHDWEVRFDIISIVFPPSGKMNLHHFEDAFFS